MTTMTFINYICRFEIEKNKQTCMMFVIIIIHDEWYDMNVFNFIPEYTHIQTNTLKITNNE